MLPTNKLDKVWLLSLFDEGVACVRGRASVARVLKKSPATPDQIIAVGKAATDMCLGAFDILKQPVSTLVVTKHNHGDAGLSQLAHVSIMEAGHPIPDAQSLLAGQAILDQVGQMSADESLLLLISGGASAVAECLVEGMSLNQWMKMSNQLIASGKDIAQINKQRRQYSLIKGGRLLENFKGKHVVVLAVSDVQNDDISVIGSGIGSTERTDAKADVKIIASNQIAREGIEKMVKSQGLVVRCNNETLYDDVFVVAKTIGKILCQGEKGVYIWGGEPTIVLPENPGEGGRSQSLALAISQRISGMPNCQVLVAGTDGTDGPGDVAGAVVDGQTFYNKELASVALQKADAGGYLRQRNELFTTGPTGTNVMDLVLAVVV